VTLNDDDDDPPDPLSDAAGGDRFDLADLGLEAIECVRLSGADAYPHDPVSNGPDIDGVYGRGQRT
jgi:hypothetical protein